MKGLRQTSRGLEHMFVHRSAEQRSQPGSGLSVNWAADLSRNFADDDRIQIDQDCEKGPVRSGDGDPTDDRQWDRRRSVATLVASVDVMAQHDFLATLSDDG
jgi:hypothetical protein